LISANLVNAGDDVLITNIGYFGDRWGECFETYGAKVQHLRAAPGDRPTPEQIVQALEKNPRISMVTLTHVDTSTGVRMDLEACTKAIKSFNPNILVAVDGVCAVAGEELQMRKWDIDAYMTGSQKAIGVPGGLSISVFRPNALKRAEDNANGRSFYANVAKWLPIMRAYEAMTPSYFATPAINNIYGLHQGYNILLQNGSMPQRFQEHEAAAKKFRNAMKELNLDFVPVKEEYAAHTMSAIKYPELKSDFGPPDFLKLCAESGAVFAGGLHADIKNTYFRVGHMGLSSRTPEHLQQTVHAIQQALKIAAVNPPTKDVAGGFL